MSIGSGNGLALHFEHPSFGQVSHEIYLSEWKVHSSEISITIMYFKAMGEFKLESQSGNAQLGSKSAIFCPVWPWNLSDDLEQAKSEGFDSCNRPGNLTQIGLKLLIFQPMTLKFDGWPRKIIGHLFYITSNFVHHFKSISEFKLELQSGNTQFRSKSAIFCPVWRNLTYDLERQKAPFLCCFKHFASFHSHWWIQTGVTVRKHLVWVKFNDFLAVWPWNLLDDLEKNRAPLWSNIELRAPFHHHLWIQTGVTVRKQLSWVLTPVTLTFDLWPWPFAWISPWWLVIIPENVIWWSEHSKKKVWQTDRRTS